MSTAQQNTAAAANGSQIQEPLIAENTAPRRSCGKIAIGTLLAVALLSVGIVAGMAIPYNFTAKMTPVNSQSSYRSTIKNLAELEGNEFLLKCTDDTDMECFIRRGRLYAISSWNATWDEAEAFCESMTPGASLAVWENIENLPNASDFWAFEDALQNSEQGLEYDQNINALLALLDGELGDEDEGNEDDEDAEDGEDDEDFELQVQMPESQEEKFQRATLLAALDEEIGDEDDGDDEDDDDEEIEVMLHIGNMDENEDEDEDENAAILEALDEEIGDEDDEDDEEDDEDEDIQVEVDFNVDDEDNDMQNGAVASRRFICQY